MQIWRLKPIVFDSTSWQASAYRGEVIVRAKNESEARKVAIREFGIATKAKLGKPMRSYPWNDPNIVSCELLDTADYEKNGPTTVFLPKR